MKHASTFLITHVPSILVLLVVHLVSAAEPVASERSGVPGVAPKGDVRIEKKVAYLGADRQEKGDLYMPADMKPGQLCPAVIIIHGGGWAYGQKDAGREINIGTNLALNGYVAFSIDYVLAKADSPTWPRNLHDCKSAVRWLRKNAERLHIDPGHIGAIGGSAGGHLAAMLAVTGPDAGLDPKGPYGEYSCQIQAAVDLYGPADLMTWPPCDRTPMLPANRSERSDLYQQASIATHADKDDPPILVIHGTKDDCVPLEQSERLAAALKKAGVTAELVILENAPHSFHLQPKERDLRPLVIGFFDKHLKPTPGQTVPVKRPLHAFCGTGDHLWVRNYEPVDSPATIQAMVEWMNRTYGVTRLYWRGGQMGIWDSEYKIGEETPTPFAWARGWVHHLQSDLRINETAVRVAKSRGMEVFLYTGLFEHGVQPDVGIISPYLLEDRLRREHPEWCPVDRWQERRCPGPLCFGYPEVRRVLVERYVREIAENGYDGVTFYTYVENVGLRYPDEFGFNPLIVEEFAKHCPGVDLRRNMLTAEQKAIWYRCRGKFVTEFLRDLHTALAKQGRKLSIILDAKNPDYPQPWWGKKTPGTGLIHMDWRAWIEQGTVDELWVQLGAMADQQALLDELLPLCRKKPVRLVVRTPEPFSAKWEPYVAAGVTPVAVVTAPRNGIERLTLDPVGPDSMRSTDWRQRAQAAADVTTGKLKIPAKDVASLLHDPHVLVRRKALHALTALGDPAHVPEIETALSDPESSVRIAAAAALVTVHGPGSPQKILAALERDGYFQFKEACTDGLAGMKEKALPSVQAGLKSPAAAVQGVCIRALYRLGKNGLTNQVWEPLRTVLVDPDADWHARYWAADGLVGLRLEATEAQRQQLGADLLAILDSPAPTGLQLQAAWGLGYLAGLLPTAQTEAARESLARLFLQFGDGCTRSDAAFGWRVVGNALAQSGQPGVDLLETMRQQGKDKWLAWIAYEIVHVPQKSRDMILVPESEAVATHDRYAPPFPGVRSW